MGAADRGLRTRGSDVMFEQRPHSWILETAANNLHFPSHGCFYVRERCIRLRTIESTEPRSDSPIVLNHVAVVDVAQTVVDRTCPIVICDGRIAAIDSPDGAGVTART